MPGPLPDCLTFRETSVLLRTGLVLSRLPPGVGEALMVLVSTS